MSRSQRTLIWFFFIFIFCSKQYGRVYVCWFSFIVISTCITFVRIHESIHDWQQSKQAHLSPPHFSSFFSTASPLVSVVTTVNANAFSSKHTQWSFFHGFKPTTRANVCFESLATTTIFALSIVNTSHTVACSSIILHGVRFTVFVWFFCEYFGSLSSARFKTKQFKCIQQSIGRGTKRRRGSETQYVCFFEHLYIFVFRVLIITRPLLPWHTRETKPLHNESLHNDNTCNCSMQVEPSCLGFSIFFFFFAFPTRLSVPHRNGSCPSTSTIELKQHAFGQETNCCLPT